MAPDISSSLATATVELRTQDDVVRLRSLVRDLAVTQALSLVDQTKLITAASELGRNTMIHGGGGEVVMTPVAQGPKRGVRLTFTDKGPGIPDIPRALTDGYTTGNGLGLGLSGSKRLCDEFTIESAVGVGTTISVVKWKR